ncbi:hypothetical protein [Parasphingorhabdus litoris]|uniref:hypothetical protein n=1 Tax=Parasphingorhabdus litoris TaxID=394733 RepID=UPI001E3A2336|nr:hypothetical protein [Parasphingorhabdus litoris]
MAVSIHTDDHNTVDQKFAIISETKAEKLLGALSRYVGYLGLLAALAALIWLIFL